LQWQWTTGFVPGSWQDIGDLVVGHVRQAGECQEALQQSRRENELLLRKLAALARCRFRVF
jgi:hypothetical protein